MDFMDVFRGASRQKDPEAELTGKLLIRSMNLRDGWVEDNLRYERLYLTDQWTREERKYLLKHKQYPLEINISAPVIDGMVALSCANAPTYRTISPTGKSDKLNSVASFVMEYVGHTSDLKEELISAAYDFYKVGIGWLMADIDTTMDYGYGEVVNRYVPWTDVHWDYRARRPGYRDAEWMIVYGEKSAGRLKATYPDMAEKITRASTRNWAKIFDESALKMTSSGGKSKVHMQGDYPSSLEPQVSDQDNDDRMLPVLERYDKVYKVVWSVFDPGVGYETFLTDKEFNETEMDRDVRERAYKLRLCRIRKTISIGDEVLLDSYDLPISEFPLVPIVKAGNISKYPVGIMSRLEDINYEQNKRRMAIIANANASSAGRVIGPENAIDQAVWDRRSRIPGAYIPYKTSMEFSDQQFVPLNPQPLPNQFFYLDQTTIELAEYVSGVDSALLGNSRNLPSTLGQTQMLEEYGTRKIKTLDLTVIETALQRLGEVTLQLSQWWYDEEKTLSIVDDNGVMSQVVINRADITSEGEVRGYMNDIRGMNFIVKVVPGSTRPFNRRMKLMENMEMYEKGLCTAWEVIKYSNIINKEEVFERISQIQQAKRAIEDQAEQIEKMGVIIQQLERQLRNMKIKSQVDEQMKTVELAVLQRKMKEKTAAALVELSQKQFIEQISREEAALRRVREAKMAAEVSSFRSQIGSAQRIAENEIANRVAIVEEKLNRVSRETDKFGTPSNRN